MSIAGLHHVTAIASSAQATTDFWVRVLGMTLVKRTVNLDDPSSHHLYFGDAFGSPGSLVTYFAGPRMRRDGRPGAGQATSVAMRVPKGTLERWKQRLARLGVPCAPSPGRFGDRALALDDPDGIRIELVEGDAHAGEMWPTGLHAVTLTVLDAAASAALLEDAFGLRADGGDETFRRFAAPGAESAERSGFVDLLQAPRAAAGRMAAGAIHHVAFRARDDAHQQALAAAVRESGARPGEVLNRKYFRSFYFRESGRVLFEVATDAPGFAVDEPAGKLGMSLCLPPWLEERRAEIAAALPPLTVPQRAK